MKISMQTSLKHTPYKITKVKLSPLNINRANKIKHELEQANGLWQHTEFHPVCAKMSAEASALS